MKKNNNNNDINIDLITPENFELIKCNQYKKYKWILFRKKNENEKLNNIIDNNKIEEKINDYYWIKYTNEKKFNEFGQIQINNSEDLLQQIEELKDYQAELLQKLSKTENDYHKLNLNFAKFFKTKKTGELNQDKLIETIEKLRKENNKLQNTLMNMKQGDNFIGISFIEDDLNNSQFIDDYNFDEIIDNFNQAGIYVNNNNNKISNQLKNSIISLIGQINLTQNIKLTLVSIFKQFGINDEEIYQLFGKKRGGVITINQNQFE